MRHNYKRDEDTIVEEPPQRSYSKVVDRPKPTRVYTDADPFTYVAKQVGYKYEVVKHYRETGEESIEVYGIFRTYKDALSWIAVNKPQQ